MKTTKLAAAVAVAVAISALIYISLASIFKSQLSISPYFFPSQFHLYLIIISVAVSAALVAYIFVMLNLIKQPEQPEVKPKTYPPPISLNSKVDSPFTLSVHEENKPQIEEKTLNSEILMGANSKNSKPELDLLIAKIIREKIEDGSLEFRPRLTLRHSGEYEVLGRRLKGEVKLALVPKRERKAGLKIEKRNVEEIEEEKEEPLF